MAHILIVDDDPLFGRMLAQHLQRCGYTADNVESGLAALKKVKGSETAYDFYLIDQRLDAEMTGIELMTALHRETPTAETIIFTGYGGPEEIRHAIRAGASRYLPKPFESDEVVGMLDSLVEQRDTFDETEWVHILNEITESVQNGLSVQDVADVLVKGGYQFGFERVRLFRLDSLPEHLYLLDTSVVGDTTLTGKETVRIPLCEAHYAQIIFKSGYVTVFNDFDLEHDYLYQKSDGKEALPVGDWVGIRLVHEGSDFGMLLLDNTSKPTFLQDKQRELLTLFARQASIAFARAVRYEREHVIDKVVRGAGNLNAPDSLERLLKQIPGAFSSEKRSGRFVVVLNSPYPSSPHPDWFYCAMHQSGGESRGPKWLNAAQKNMVTFAADHPQPLFLPEGTHTFCKERGLRQSGSGNTRSWMSVPLRVGKHMFGALIMADDNQTSAYTEQDFGLFQQVATQLSPLIQVTYASKQRKELTEVLNLLHRASEDVIKLALEGGGNWLWHATLTLATARYGGGFNRAMLFLQRGEKQLCGRMGIGHFTVEEAKKDWEDDEENKMNFDTYQAVLRARDTKTTPINSLVRRMIIDLDGESAFADVLKSGKPRTISEANAPSRLPSEFIENFGATDYVLVPVKSDQTIGVLVLDKVWRTEPWRDWAVDYLDTLTNQAALIHKLMQKEEANRSLIDVTHESLVDVGTRPLKQTLTQICDSIKTVMQADRVAIYPLRDGEAHQYDVNNIVASDDKEIPIEYTAIPTERAEYILNANSVLRVQDAQKPWKDSGGIWPNERSEDVIMKQLGIRSYLAVSIRGIGTGSKRGILFIDYRSTQNFDERHEQLAESFASLAALALRQSRDYQSVISSKEAKAEELGAIGRILERAMNDVETTQDAADVKASTANEKALIQSLLEAVMEQFPKHKVKASLLLVDWKRVEENNTEPQQIYKRYFFDENGNFSQDKELAEEKRQGISGQTFQDGESRLAQNVHSPKWANIYRPRYRDTAAELDVAIKRRDGQVIGVLTLETPETALLTQDDLVMLERFANTMALALGDIRRRRFMLSVLEAAQVMTAPTDLKETLVAVKEQILSVASDLSTLTIWYQSDDEDKLMPGESFGTRTQSTEGKALSDGGLLSGVINTKENALWSTMEGDHSTLATSNFAQREGLASSCALPLRVHGQKVVGAMFFGYRHEHIFSQDERVLYPIFAQIAAAAINDSLQMAQMRFSEAVAGATAWAADVAHDLNNHTGRIRNNAYLLLQDGSLDAKQRGWVEEIRKEAQGLAGVSASSLLSEGEPFVLKEKLEECIAEIKAKKATRIQVNYEFENAHIKVHGNPHLFYRAIRHLIRNSVDAMVESAEKHLVISASMGENQQVEIRIQDSGKGIPASIREKMFKEPFSMKGKERGYGLLFARDTIKRMNGNVYLPAQPKKGAIFAITLPLQSDQHSRSLP